MASTKEGEWVLDPFNGSGTTGVAASLLGRKYLGIDMDTGYLELAYWIKKYDEAIKAFE